MVFFERSAPVRRKGDIVRLGLPGGLNMPILVKSKQRMNTSVRVAADCPLPAADAADPRCWKTEEASAGVERLHGTNQPTHSLGVADPPPASGPASLSFRRLPTSPNVRTVSQPPARPETVRQPRGEGERDGLQDRQRAGAAASARGDARDGILWG